jgi:hypothetical protein
MAATFLDRIEKTREQIKTWSTERLEDVQARQKALIEQGEERLEASKKVLVDRKDQLIEKKDALRQQADEALDNGVGAIRTAEATVLEAARDLLARSSDALGERAPFLARGEQALDDALVALRAGHHATLPIADFNELSIKKIEKQLDAVDAAGLRTLLAFEEANKARKTLIKSLNKRIASHSTAPAVGEA